MSDTRGGGGGGGGRKRAGRIEQIGPPQEVYHNPSSLFVARFLKGESNVISGIARREGGAWSIECRGLPALRAHRAAIVTPDTNAHYVIRPECIHWGRQDASDTVVPGRIRDRLLVMQSGSSSIPDMARSRSSTFIGGRKMSPNPARRVHLSWRSGDAVLVPHSNEGERRVTKLIYEKHGKTAILTINRPQSMNAYDAETIREMENAFWPWTSDRELRVAILTAPATRPSVPAPISNPLHGKSFDGRHPGASGRRSHLPPRPAGAIAQAGHSGRQRLLPGGRARARLGLRSEDRVDHCVLRLSRSAQRHPSWLRRDAARADDSVRGRHGHAAYRQPAWRPTRLRRRAGKRARFAGGTPAERLKLAETVARMRPLSVKHHQRASVARAPRPSRRLHALCRRRRSRFSTERKMPKRDRCAFAEKRPRSTRIVDRVSTPMPQLDALLYPESIAVIGASSDARKAGGQALAERHRGRVRRPDHPNLEDAKDLDGYSTFQISKQVEEPSRPCRHPGSDTRCTGVGRGLRSRRVRSVVIISADSVRPAPRDRHWRRR